MPSDFESTDITQLKGFAAPMKTWTYFMLLIWTLLALVIALPTYVLSDQYQDEDALQGTYFALESSAVAELESDSFFAIDASGEVFGAAKKDSSYLLELNASVGDSWKVIEGSPNITIAPEVGATYFKVIVLKSFGDWFTDAVLLFIVTWCIWVLGLLVLAEWKKA